MFCENTRGQLPENGQSEKTTKMGLFKAKTKGSVLQSSRTEALEFNHTKGLEQKKEKLYSGPYTSHSPNCVNIAVGIFHDFPD